jgi:hypothetical protein
MDRLQAKECVVKEVREGRLTLLEAAVRFRDLNAQGRPNPMPLQEAFTGSTDAERVCRQVISWVYEEVRLTDTRQAEKLRASLEEDLRHLLARQETLSWPEEPAR